MLLVRNVTQLGSFSCHLEDLQVLKWPDISVAGLGVMISFDLKVEELEGEERDRRTHRR